MKHNPGFLDVVNDAKRNIREMTVDEVAKRLVNGDKFLLIDVREDNEFADDHLPGAIHLGKGVIERDIEKTLPDKGTELVLYCGGGFRSALAAESIQKMGYTNVWSMDGGYKGWINGGHPTASQGMGKV